MDTWQPLIDIVILLLAALVLGTVAEWLRQNAIVGYLVAGTLVGPHVLGLVEDSDQMHLIAELGVALLLFTIGLEFSFDRLKKLGRIALAIGSLQIIITAAVFTGIAALFGWDAKGAVVVGLMVAMSSTACVIRLLQDRAVLDTVYGRHALGVLLVQDVAVVPILVLISAMSKGGDVAAALGTLGLAVIAGLVMLGVFYLLSSQLVARALHLHQWARNRELPVLLAIVMALGATIIAHRLHLSPALGAFVAGMLLGGSPFAVQIRSDVGAIKTVLVTLFFASIGMLGNPAWALQNAPLVIGVVGLIVVFKAALLVGILRGLRQPTGIGLATGLCLAQVGEFSFVIAQIAAGTELIDTTTFELTVTSTILTLFLTPYLVRAAPLAARAIERRRRRAIAPTPAPDARSDAGPPILLVGFGPAGQRVAEALLADHHDQLIVVDSNPRNLKMAESYGLGTQVGDATRHEVIEHAGVEHAVAVVITIPDADAARQVIHLVRQLNPNATVLARARYHVFRWELQFAGAHVVVDEEDQLGMALATRVESVLRGEAVSDD